jgi:galactokinase
MTMEKENLFKEAKSFFQVFEPKGEIITGIKVPGSVQIIGDAYAHNRGRVIAANLNKSAYLMAQKRKEGDRSLNFYSQKYDEKIRLSLNAPERREEHGWAYYMASTLFMLEGSSKKVCGMNVYIDNRIPDLFNSNSMEALEAGIANIGMKFSDWQMDGIEMSKVCAEGEKRYLDMESHFVKYVPLMLGKKNTVTYFDEQTGENGNIKVDFGSLTFMVMSSGLKKKHAEEKRKKIYQEVAAAIDIMKKNGANIDTLDQLTMEQFDDYRSKLTMDQRKRCAYFISENERVKAAKDILGKGNVKGFVDIINDSQKNIKNRLEVVLEENEILIDMILDAEGVRAARMLNMGTDGTVLVVVDKDKKAAAESKIKKTFITRTGLELTSEVFNLDNEMEEYSIDVSEFKK